MSQVANTYLHINGLQIYTFKKIQYGDNLNNRKICQVLSYNYLINPW
jgi:hypothetical protein